jgi:hypothetical protein
MKTLILLLSIMVGMHALPAQAGLGWTLAECKMHYGAPITAPKHVFGRTVYNFRSQGFIIGVALLDNTVSRIVYTRPGAVLDTAAIRTLLDHNAPDATWGDSFKDNADNTNRYRGAVDGVNAYFASASGNTLCIWTSADDAMGVQRDKEADKDL